MIPFTKTEKISLIVIFSILIIVAAPNFIASLKRARDQIRRDDIGAVNHALDRYLADFNNGLPMVSKDGRILNCLAPGDAPINNGKGGWSYTPIPCNWGVDAFKNLITGDVYMKNLPNDPDYKKGAQYLYLTDGDKYQIFGSMEDASEAEIDPVIIARNLPCGVRICNFGRSYNCPIDISIEEYNKLLIEKSNTGK